MAGCLKLAAAVIGAQQSERILGTALVGTRNDDNKHASQPANVVALAFAMAEELILDSSSAENHVASREAHHVENVGDNLGFGQIGLEDTSVADEPLSASETRPLLELFSASLGNDVR